MEYLTLQDIPHRHCNPLHAQRMASTHPSERPLGSMAAAVCDSYGTSSSFSVSSSSSHSSRSSLPTLYPPLSVRKRESFDDCLRRSSDDGFFQKRVPAPPLHCVRLPSLPVTSDGEDCARGRPEIAQPLALRNHPHHHISHHLLLRKSPRMVPSTYANKDRRLPIPHAVVAPAHTPARHIGATSRWNSTLTDTQHHHMRSSPPIQPGEQAHAAKLPSFSEVCTLILSTAKLLLTRHSSSTPHGHRHHHGRHLAGTALLTVHHMPSCISTMSRGAMASAGATTPLGKSTPAHLSLPSTHSLIPVA